MLLFSLSPAEKKRFILVILAFMCVTSAALVARTTADTLFLARFGHHYLAYMYLGTAVVVSSVAFVYSTLIGRLSILYLTCLSICFLIVLLITLKVGLSLAWPGVPIAAYFVGDLTVHIPMMLFWSFAVFLFDPRQAKQLFGFIGAGGTLGCILIGFVVKPFANHFGPPSLILLIIGLLACFIVLVIRLGITEAHRLPTAKNKGKTSSQLQQYIHHFKTPQIKHLIGLVFVANIALSLIDYQFKAGARLQYAPAELAGFFGNFYALTSIVALLIQLFFVHQILQKGGIKLGLSLLPLGILAGCLGVLFSAEFRWILTTKVMVQIFLFTIDTAALQMLFLSIPIASRNQARAFADGITKPVAIAVAGIALVGLVNFIPLHFLALGGIVLSVCWLLLVRTNSEAYVLALIDSLNTKKFDQATETTPFQDHTVVAYIREALQTASDEDIIYLISLSREISEENWTPDYRNLIYKDDPTIKIQCLRHLTQNGDQSDIPRVRELLNHSNGNIRAEAILTLSKLGEADTVNTLEPYLNDSDPAVQAATIACLVNQGDLDQLIDAGIKFRTLLKSNNKTDRVAAAQSLTHITDSTFKRSLICLLQDSDIEVKKAALETCAKIKDPALLPVLTPLLGAPEIGVLTTDVLAHYGTEAIDCLLPYLLKPTSEEPSAETIQIPEVLSKIGDLKALPALLKSADSPHPELRSKSIHAYATLIKTTTADKAQMASTCNLIHNEMVEANHKQTQLNSIGSDPELALLADALRQICNVHLKNAFVLLDAIFPQIDIMSIFETLLSNTHTNNNALEILDTILPKQIKTDIIPFFERNQKPDDVSTIPKFDEILSTEKDPWILCGALLGIVHQQQELVDTTIESALSHPHPAVRETILYTIFKQNDMQRLKTHCEYLQQDPDPTVRKLANQYLNNLQDNSNSKPNS